MSSSETERLILYELQFTHRHSSHPRPLILLVCLFIHLFVCSLFVSFLLDFVVASSVYVSFFVCYFVSFLLLLLGEGGWGISPSVNLILRPLY